VCDIQFPVEVTPDFPLLENGFFNFFGSRLVQLIDGHKAVKRPLPGSANTGEANVLDFMARWA
jgi:hypothetical protein